MGEKKTKILEISKGTLYEIRNDAGVVISYQLEFLTKHGTLRCIDLSKRDHEVSGDRCAYYIDLAASMLEKLDGTEE